MILILSCECSEPRKNLRSYGMRLFSGALLSNSTLHPSPRATSIAFTASAQLASSSAVTYTVDSDARPISFCTVLAGPFHVIGRSFK